MNNLSRWCRIRAPVRSSGRRQTVSAERARTFDEGIDYDKRIVVQLDQAADDGNPRLWLSAPVCLIVSSEEGVPVRIETEGGSEYLILVL